MASLRQVVGIGRTCVMVGARRASVRTAASSAAASAEPIKAPIQVYGVEGRYAHALFTASSKSKAMEKVETELKDFQGLMKANPRLTDFLNNPTIKKHQKKESLVGILKDKKFSSLTQNLFAAMAENNRLSRAAGMIKAYCTIMSAYRGEITCTVTTAKPLDSKSEKELTASLQGFVKKGQVLKIDTQTDPAIIGGMILEIGDKYVDMSLATKIKKILQHIAVDI